MVAEVWQQNLDYTKNLQAKYFTGKNIPIYGITPHACARGKAISSVIIVVVIKRIYSTTTSLVVTDTKVVKSAAWRSRHLSEL